MILVIDNYDSFTYNLVQYLGELGEAPDVRRNDAVTVDEIRALAPEAIVSGPVVHPLGGSFYRDESILAALDAAILSAAMLLRYSLNKGADADRIDAAVLRVLEDGHRTRDIVGAGGKICGTREMGDLISTEVEKSYS